MALYWIITSQEQTPRLMELVERESGLHREIIASKGCDGELMLLEVSNSIVDPNYVKIVNTSDGLSLQNDNINRIAKAWEIVRTQRDELLAECDWTQLSDCRLSAEDKAAWSEYRQALRDVPQNNDDPEDDVIWPVKPGE